MQCLALVALVFVGIYLSARGMDQETVYLEEELNHRFDAFVQKRAMARRQDVMGGWQKSLSPRFGVHSTKKL